MPLEPHFQFASSMNIRPVAHTRTHTHTHTPETFLGQAWLRLFPTGLDQLGQPIVVPDERVAVRGDDRQRSIRVEVEASDLPGLGQVDGSSRIRNVVLDLVLIP
eukprot:COSAG01_NODE_29608_length_633_cov_29.713483_1_plen_104_part_00